MTYLCLDPSLRAYGWCIIQNGYLIACGCILTVPHKVLTIVESDTVRIQTISQSLAKIVNQYKPDQIVFENFVGSKSSRAMQSLSYSKAITIAVATSLNVPFVGIKAKTAKKELTSNDAAQKKEILEVVQKSFKNFDILMEKANKADIYAASDAISIYLAYKSIESSNSKS